MFPSNIFILFFNVLLLVNCDSGLLQGALVSVYIMYLTWLAMVSEPSKEIIQEGTLKGFIFYIFGLDLFNVLLQKMEEMLQKSYVNPSFLWSHPIHTLYFTGMKLLDMLEL